MPEAPWRKTIDRAKPVFIPKKLERRIQRNMLIKKGDDIKSSEITDKKVYLNRRLFMRAAALAATVTATGLVYRRLNPPPTEIPKGDKLPGLKPPVGAANSGFMVNEKLTSLEDITNYNNFYEFS